MQLGGIDSAAGRHRRMGNARREGAGLGDRWCRTAAVRRSDPNVPVKLVAVPAGPLDVRLPRGPVDVRLHYTDQSPMPVGVTRIKPAAEWEPIRSAAEPEPTRPKPGGR